MKWRGLNSQLGFIEEIAFHLGGGGREGCFQRVELGLGSTVIPSTYQGADSSPISPCQVSRKSFFSARLKSPLPVWQGQRLVIPLGSVALDQPVLECTETSPPFLACLSSPSDLHLANGCVKRLHKPTSQQNIPKNQDGESIVGLS